MTWKNLAAAACVLFACLACQPDATQANYERAHDPWVFRSVLDGKPRMLTLALHDNLWASYHSQTANLYKVWKGGVNFDGAVYTTVHGPQPSSLGDAYFENAFDNAWLVVAGENKITPTVDFKGHRFEQGQVTLRYELQLPSGEAITVYERPEYLENESGQTGMERTFTLGNVPQNMDVYFQFNLSSIASERNISTNGELEVTDRETRKVDNIEALDLTAALQLNRNEPTHLTTYFTQPLLENENKVVGAEEEEERPLGYRLIARNDCKTCHNTYVKTIGPAYVDVARKYRNTPSNVKMLAGKVKNGGSGVWGEAIMNAHPEVAMDDITAMVEYIMTLDAEEEAELAETLTEKDMSELEFMGPAAGVDEANILPGAVARIYAYPQDLNELADIDESPTPVYEGVIPEIFAEAGDLKGLEDNFAIIVEGFLKITKDNNYTFRLSSDDGSRLTIDDQVVIDNDGLHGMGPKDGEIALKAGYHPFRVDYFQGRGGKGISLKWRSFDDDQFSVIGSTTLVHDRNNQPDASAVSPPMAVQKRIPGDGYALESVHPSYTLTQARPDEFSPKVGGMDFLPDGRLVVSTWDAEGAVYIVDGAQTGDPAKMTYKKIASGLAEPLGLKVVDGDIYVLQKQELTKLIDHDGDEVIDEYYALCNDWRVSANFHEFAFGLAYKDGWFYGTLAIAILPGGASANPQIPDRGKVIRINKETGEMEFVASGLRTPNGIGLGVDDEIFVADNQGDWLPSSKILHVTTDAFFGSRAVDSAAVAKKPVKLPVVWLPQDEIGNSPSTPLALNDGPYAGQMIHGEVTHGGVKRVFVEEVNGQYQGAVFRFIQGLEAGVNRMAWGPDGALYVGGIGSSGNWQHSGGLWYGLQRLQYNDQPTFEMLAVRARSNGVEIEFTEPLEAGLGWDPTDYTVQQWYYLPTNEYGGPKLDQVDLPVRSAHVSQDRKKVFLELGGMKPNHVIYLRLPAEWTSSTNLELWSTEAWYTMNQIPDNTPGFTAQRPAPTPVNALSEAEKAAGWELLFDGKSLDGWHNYNQESIGSSWVIEQDAIHLKADERSENGWQVADGGDIVFDQEYEDFELRLEWRISACGNSGIMYHVVESEEYAYPWMTGPEMQVLDNTCHPDAKIETHRAGDLYDIQASKYVTVKPAGEWNSVRIRIKDGQLEQWQNGRKVVATEMWTDAWYRALKNSKWKDHPDFGESRTGKIALQDHGDPVWFRNIKIRRLND